MYLMRSSCMQHASRTLMRMPHQPFGSKTPSIPAPVSLAVRT